MKKNQKKFYQRRVFWIVGGILAVSVAVGGRMAMARQEMQAKLEALRNGAATAEVSEGTIVSVVSASGSLFAAENVEITAPTGIKVKEVLVETGDSVRRGDVLAELDPISIVSGLAKIADDIEAIDDALDDDDDLSRWKREELQLSRSELLEYREQLVELKEHPVIIAAADGVVDELYLEDALEITRSQRAGSAAGSSAAVSGYGTGAETMAGVTLPTSYRAEAEAGTGAALPTSYRAETGAGTEAVLATSYRSRNSSGRGVRASRPAVSRGGFLLLAAGEEPDETFLFADGEPDADEETDADIYYDYDYDYEDGGAGADWEEPYGPDAIQVTDFSAFVIEAPRTGGIPQRMLAETDAYAGTIVWTPDDGVFAPSTVYSAQCTLYAKEGYTFYGVELTGLPGEWFYSVSEDGMVLDVTITYPMTEPEENPGTLPSPTEVPDPEIPTPPAGGTGSTPDPGINPGINPGGNPTPGLTPPVTPTLPLMPTPTIPQLSDIFGNFSFGLPSMPSVSMPSVSTASGVTGQIVSGSSGYYSNYETVVCVVRKQNKMKLQVSVDELDILSLEMGQRADVTIDAIPGRTFEGIISEISDSAKSGSGSAKYAVDILLAADEDMRLGMSASAKIEVAKAEHILTLPMLALQQSGNEMFVYTAQNDDGSLGGMQNVTTGVSDGELVEITEGLTAGETVYYLRSGEDSQGDIFASTSPFAGSRRAGGAADGGGGDDGNNGNDGNDGSDGSRE